MRKLVGPLLFLTAACAGRPAAAPEPVPASAPADAVELVESAPLETTLDHPDVPNAADVWVAMIGRAKKTIDFAEFYASGGPALDPVIDAVLAAVRRGVRVRFLADALFAPKYPETLAQLEKGGVTIKILEWEKLHGGGIHHAKYFVVDGEEAFVGSQNFDWRALAHIQELGARIRSRAIAEELEQVFETDFGASPVKKHDQPIVRTGTGETISLGVDPNDDDLPKLVALLDGATTTIDLQVLTYKTKERNGSPFFTLEDALKRAIARKVKVRVLVSSWSKPDDTAGLAAAGAEVKVITIPKWSGGEIPFARVCHAKFVVVDRTRTWVGTSNWEGDYFDKSRNVAVYATGGRLPAQAQAIFDGDFVSAYAAPPASNGPAPP